jgi:phage tail sheath protein FI
MPEYLAPGVYVEETSYRARSIEGVSTTITGFIGPTRYGPVDIPPDVVTSLTEFEQVYGGRQQLNFKADDGLSDMPPMVNFIWQALNAYFQEGGKQAYVVRVFRPNSDADDGRASAWLPTKPADPSDPNSVRVAARFPGVVGAMRVRLTVTVGQNILTGGASNAPQVPGLLPNDLVWLINPNAASPLVSPPAAPPPGKYYVAQTYYDAATKQQTWRFVNDPSSPYTSPLTSPLSGGSAVELRSLVPDLNPGLSDQVRVVTLKVTAEPLDGSAAPQVWSNVPLDPGHARNGTPDSVFDQFAEKFSDPTQGKTVPLTVTRGDPLVTHIQTGVDVLDMLLHAAPGIRAALDDPSSTDDARSIDLILTGGNDGRRPTASEYQGAADPDTTYKTGLTAFDDLDDVSILAAPGSTYGLETPDYGPDARTIVSLLINQATQNRYQIAVIDSGDGQSLSQVRRFRATIDTSYAALYYPWVRVLDPLTNTQIFLPPSGFVAGIYARNDINRAVFKAPANEVVNLALGFEVMISKAQQEVLNPEGINCFRFFEGRGYRLWGARTATSNTEMIYVSLRRYFVYLEHSIDKGTQFAVFEPNGENLWGNVRRMISSFLLDEWRAGGLLGSKPEEAYFVRCDRSTMSQNDLDNGRLICLVGVAPVKPAEFVIFRIGQFTAGSTT